MKKKIIKKGKLVSEKAGLSYLQIFILIMASFAFAYVIYKSDEILPQVSAVDVNVCCEKTNSGFWCQNSLPGDCNTGFRQTPTSCSATSFCRPGCCYDSQEGLCMENTPQRVCNDKNGTWAESASCDIPQCNLGCCVLGDQAALVTLTRCKRLSSFYGLETDFRKEIQDELTCIGIAQSEDKGACVFEDEFVKTCKFITRKECESIGAGGTESVNGSLTSKPEFFKDYLCSAEELGANCGPTTKTTCADGKDEVYFLDSCGNLANIYDASKINDKSYWKKIIDKSESCGYGQGNADSASCGNCDYYLGSYCKQAARTNRATYGDNICKDLNCYDTSDGKDHKHGETWCSYDGTVGEGKDAVGSRHFRHSCVNGEELIEACADFRNEVCYEDSITTTSGPFSQAGCRVNRWQECVLQTKQKDCENTDKRDCFWKPGFVFTRINAVQSGGVQTEKTFNQGGAGTGTFSQGGTSTTRSVTGNVAGTGQVITGDALFGGDDSESTTPEEKDSGIIEGGGLCLPDFSPGFNFWEGGEAESICSRGNAQCVVEYEKKILGGEKCIKNCECLEEGWAQDMNEICVALGDCGGYVNYLGKYTEDGYDWIVEGENKKIGGAAYGYTPTGRAISLGGLNALVVAMAKTGSWITGGNVVSGVDGVTVTPVITGMSKVTPVLSKLKVANLPGTYKISIAGVENPININQIYLNTETSAYGVLHNGEFVAASPEVLSKAGLETGALKFQAASATSGHYQGWLASQLGVAEGGLASSLVTGLQWAAIAYLVGYLVGGLIGLDKNNQKALSLALATGAFTWKALAAYKFEAGGWAAKWLGAHPLAWGIGVAVVVFLLMYKKESKETVIFNCHTWQAPVGGGDCETCNKDKEGNPCSQYRCKSLGQACELLNPGTEEERCTWVNPRDVKSPGISPWEEVLTAGYEYTDVRIRPPGDGSEPGRMTIEKEGGGCVKAWTPLEFGITTLGPDNKEEPAQCKIDYNHTLKFDDMSFWFGESNLFRYNHSQIMNLPSPEAINAAAPELQNDGTYSLYVRCQDANGNQNIDEYVIRFCVDKGPDVTPPKIESTSIINGMPVQFGVDKTDIDVYVNEPAECKWSRQDKPYNDMENQMACSTQIWEMNNQMLYTCKTILTGIEDRKNNNFYFRCKDQPWAAEGDRNVNQQSYKFTLKGTEQLTITKVLPNGTISGSTTTVPVELYVETENGYNNGDAICYFSTTGNEDNYLRFFETESNMHKQQQDLVTGSYKYYFKCVDLGGNTDYNSTQFIVEVDKDSPVIARVYEEDDLLKIVTTEPSDCSFSIQSCNFKIEDGANMPYANQKEHFAEWKTDTTYYIKCKDAYGNQPNPAECSMIVRPYNVARD